MPTIEVEDSDQVFVVKGRGAVRGGYHVLGENDLLVMVQRLENDDGSNILQYARVYVGGNRVSGFEDFTLRLNYMIPEEIVFRFPSTGPPEGWSESHVVDLVRRLGFVTIQYSDSEEQVQADPIPLPEPSVVVTRISRYDRKPVI